MIPAHTITVSDEELTVICDALGFYAKEYERSDDPFDDEVGASRFRRIADELSRRLPVIDARLAA